VTFSVTLSSAGPAAFSARHVSSLWLRLEETLLISRTSSQSESCWERRDGVTIEPPTPRRAGSCHPTGKRTLQRGTVTPGGSCLGDEGQLGSHVGEHPLAGGRWLGGDAAGEVDAVPLAQDHLGVLDADGRGLCRGERGEQSHRPATSHPGSTGKG